MADVRTFRAATMREALDLVRDKLGADAVILHTRQVARRRFLPWRKPIAEVEITASLTLDAANAAIEKRSQSKAASVAARPETRPTTARTATPGTRSARGGQLDLASEPSESIDEILGRARTVAKGAQTRGAGPEAKKSDVPKPAPRAFFQAPAAPARDKRSEQALVADARLAPADGSDPTAALARRLDVIQQMLQDLGRSHITARREEIPDELFDLYTELIESEVHEDLARELIFQLKQSASRRQLADPSAAKALLTALVESEIRCCEPIAPKAGRRKVVALVGATGVGKTTTIAKLAANFRLRSKTKMGLITVDSYRVAAVEQLRTYAEIIELPMRVVTTPVEMRRALDELAGLDLILIDTAGRSPKDDLQIQELKSLLAEAHVDEVHLVLSLTSSLRALESSAAKFAAAGPTAMILTKLDEASGMGSLFSISRRIKLPISYLTAGQAVPDDIEPAHPRRIARLVLGQERVGR